jgi:hypothetical protein
MVKRHTSRRAKPDSRGGWIIYVMIHFPGFWWWKVGITGKSAKTRAKGIDRAVWGFPIPVMIAIIPGGAYRLEQFLHFVIEPFHTRFYRGDGSTEWFWLPGGVIAFCTLALINYFYFIIGLKIIDYIVKLY